MKVVFHINENHKWAMLNSNLRNILEKDSSIVLSVVINGEAVTYFTESDYQNNPKVKYHICNNSLKQRGIELHNLKDNETIVSSGVYELALLQSLNYFYIKP